MLYVLRLFRFKQCFVLELEEPFSGKGDIRKLTTVYEKNVNRILGEPIGNTFDKTLGEYFEKKAVKL